VNIFSCITSGGKLQNVNATYIFKYRLKANVF